ncbi:MAG TPA: cereblon family protein [Kofleriaceae bacterium]|nr:cereblon family protein [Kofleriaceae bacterium]
MAKETPEASRAIEDRDDDALRCARCEHHITERAFRIAVSGAHEHTFVNPAGFAYRIGCFAAAPGATSAGPLETAFSWFPGWAWQVVACARCQAHIGWLYRLADQQFHGLILDRLR